MRRSELSSIPIIQVATRVCLYAYMYMIRVGQNRIYTPFMTVNLVICLPKNAVYIYIYGSGKPYILYMIIEIRASMCMYYTCALMCINVFWKFWCTRERGWVHASMVVNLG
jgi:hypothetical protein